MTNDSDQRPRTAPRLGIGLGSIFGFPLRLSPSWFIFAAIIVVARGVYVQELLGVSALVGYLAAVALLAGFFVSVLLHELGHALVARANGIGVRGITLNLLGGYTELESSAPRPGVELAYTLAGPAVSLLLGLGSGAVWLLAPSATVVHVVAYFLMFGNLVVAIYNSLPGLPLDGGWALRAVIWAVRGDRHIGTVVAGWAGRVVAVATALVGFALYSAGLYSVVGFVIALLIAVNLWQGAGAAITSGKVMARFPLIDPVRLARPLFIVPSGTSLAEALRRAEAAGRPGAALGVADSSGRLVALVKAEEAAAVPDQRRPWVSVESVARDIAGVTSIEARLRGEDVIKAVQAHPADEYLVTAGEDVVGVLRVIDIVRTVTPDRAA